MSTYNSRTIVIHGKSVTKKNTITPTDQLQTKFGGMKNTQSVISYPKKIEEAIDNGTSAGPPKIPLEICRLIQSKRIEKNCKTQKDLAGKIKNPCVTVNEIQQMENGSMILNPDNRKKVQVVCRTLEISPVNLPKIA
jgi:hypothetical protein